MYVFGSTGRIDRRSFLRSAGALFLSALGPAQTAAMLGADAVFASAYRAQDGSYGVATLTEAGDIVHRYELPARGHDVVWSPDNNLMVTFARRPGVFAVVIDVNSVDVPLAFHAPKGRHFYGHGVFSLDGRLLYSTENDYENARGVIGIYDASSGFERIGELSSHGVGPHDLELLADGRTLVVANGGIETHPDFGRAKLNTSTMLPNLSFIDASTGNLKAHFQLPETQHQVSIRHLAMLGSETVWFACQNEGDQTQLTPLIGHVCIASGDFSTVALPEAVLSSLRGYVGSIVGNTATGQIAISSPRGHVAHVLDARSGDLVKTKHMVDICGVADHESRFCFSTGRGLVGARASELSWDNHLSTKLF